MQFKINRILSKFNIFVGRRFPRPFALFGLSKLNGKLVGAEIGVYKGEHAASLLKCFPIKKLYLIDPYTYGNYDKRKKHYGVEQDDLQTARRIAHNRIKNNKVIWVQKKSKDCVNEIPNELDFVYIDAAHNYKSVKQDIENYYPKVRKGGILAGHDFINGNCEEHSGLIQAVIEFVIKNNLKLYVHQGDWWIIN